MQEFQEFYKKLKEYDKERYGMVLLSVVFGVSNVMFLVPFCEIASDKDLQFLWMLVFMSYMSIYFWYQYLLVIRELGTQKSIAEKLKYIPFDKKEWQKYKCKTIAKCYLRILVAAQLLQLLPNLFSHYPVWEGMVYVTVLVGIPFLFMLITVLVFPLGRKRRA